MIRGHVLTVYRRTTKDADGKTFTLPMSHPYVLECSCGKWNKSGERIGAMRIQYRRHLYAVTPKIGDATG